MKHLSLLLFALVVSACNGFGIAAALLDPQGNARVQIYSLKGDLILDLGDGARPQFQP
jgi:hypothetical protein